VIGAGKLKINGRDNDGNRIDAELALIAVRSGLVEA
jgi:hypothetical protein